MKTANHILSALAAVFTLVGLSPSASAAPVISGTSGTFANGQSMTITGSAFGTKTNAGPMIWDNFEGGTNGGTVASDSSGAPIPIHQGYLAGYSNWVKGGVGSSGVSILYNNTSVKQNSTLHARANVAGYSLNLLIEPFTGFTTGNELYISFYYRMTKTGANFPRQSKAWIAYDPGSQDKAYFSTAYDNCEAGGYRTHITELVEEHDFALTGTGINGEWVRFETYLKQSSPSGNNGQWIQTAYRPTIATPTRETYDTGPSKTLRTSSSNWTAFTFGGAYYSQCGGGDTATIDVDDFYLDSTRARVEVCDTATWAARTRCELQRATAWSDTSITISFNRGYLDSSKPAYVYVIDTGGNVNAQGYAIAMGGTQPSTPQSPSNLAIY